MNNFETKKKIVNGPNAEKLRVDNLKESDYYAPLFKLYNE